jgi:hypothetical protein
MTLEPLWVVEASRHKHKTLRFYFDRLADAETECRYWEANGYVVRFWNAWGEPVPHENGPQTNE